MTRVLPAFVAALLAIAPSAGGVLAASADGGSWWAARTGEFARGGQDALVRDRSLAGAQASGRERAQGGLCVALLPVEARAAVICALGVQRGARDRIVDVRALARRTFASRRVAPYGADDPDAAV